KERFDTSTDPWGQPWKKLKWPSKKRGGASAKPLRDKGLLAASYSARGANHTEEYGPASLVWGSADQRAGWHQEGANGGIPARVQRAVSPQLEQRIERLVEDLVVEQITRSLTGRP